MGSSPIRVANLLSLVGCSAGVAQSVEQLICNQQVAGSSPFASSSFLSSRHCASKILIFMGRFPSGQREQTVNLPSLTSVVRIHPCPPCILREWRNWQTRMIQVHVYVRTCRFKSCFPHQKPLDFQGVFFLSTHNSPIPYPFIIFLLRFPTFPE